MELWLGPSYHYGSVFESREKLYQAWIKSRDRIMERYGRHGRRPQIWWQFDSGDLKYPGYDRERSYLYEHNVLTEQERVEVEHQWKAEFERAYRPHFFYTAAPGEILHGAA